MKNKSLWHGVSFWKIKHHSVGKKRFVTIFWDNPRILQVFVAVIFQVFSAHSQLLGKGFALSRPPTIMQALEGSLPFCWQSNERSFLKDFVSCTMGTSGGRLARYVYNTLSPTHALVVLNYNDPLLYSKTYENQTVIFTFALSFTIEITCIHNPITRVNSWSLIGRRLLYRRQFIGATLSFLMTFP